MTTPTAAHTHVFLGSGHEHAERRTWLVIWLCGAMMLLEIAGGSLFGSIALVADGLHMSTHAGAMLLAALAYAYARRHANDPRFSFGTGKLGDLAGFTSAIVLAMIAILIGYEAVARLVAPVPIRFTEAIPIACLGLAVNVVSAWLLSGGGHDHHGHGHGRGHGLGHGHGHGHGLGHADAAHAVTLPGATLRLSIFEDDHPPVFRLHPVSGPLPAAGTIGIETIRPGGARQSFAMQSHPGYFQSAEEIPEPHAFTAIVRLNDGQRTSEQAVMFDEHAHPAQDGSHRDNNMRAAITHVLADAAVSVLVIIGLLLAREFGWLWMDPVAGLVGAGVIASWSYGLMRDTGAILLDMVPDPAMAARVRAIVEGEGDVLADLHVWRLGPGHLGAILCVETRSDRGGGYYRVRLAAMPSLSHVTVEVVSVT